MATAQPAAFHEGLAYPVDNVADEAKRQAATLRMLHGRSLLANSRKGMVGRKAA